MLMYCPNNLMNNFSTINLNQFNVTNPMAFLRVNKAVFATASVAYGWAEAVMPFKSLFG